MIENVGDGVALVANGQRLRIVAAAAADFAGDVHVRQKAHFDAPEAVALAGFAAAALDVEAEAAGAVAALARFGEHGEKLADGRENARVGGGIRTRRAADGRLVDLDDLVNVLDAQKLPVRAGGFHRAVKLLRQGAIENVVDQRGLSRAGYARDRVE